MKHTLLILLVVLLLFPSCYKTYAQRPWDIYLDQVMEVEDAESQSLEMMYETLDDLEKNPLNVNTATREELEQLPFLTVREVEDICEYLYRYGPMKSLGELAMIEGLDFNKRQLLTYFLYVGEEKEKKFPQLSTIMKYGKQNLMLTAKIPLYDRKGNDGAYRGYNYKHNIRYSFHYGDYLKVGVVGAQDAGEPFFANKNRMGYDFYSYYVILKNMGRLKTLALGKYRAGYGMGLVMDNGFVPGKMATLATTGHSRAAIQAHSSTMSANYLQGTAATIEMLKGMDVTAFVSYRGIDATLHRDSSSIATILSSGYHRTTSELNKKNNSSQFLIGTNIRYRFLGFHVGATSIYTSFNRRLLPDPKVLHHRFSPRGKQFYNMSIDYGYINHAITFNGETATGDCGALATINSLSIRLSDQLQVTALQRFYSKEYYSLFSHSFSEGGSVQNESGFYVGVDWRFSPRFQLMAYSDYAYFPFPKYRTSFSSQAWDHFLSLSYLSEKWKVAVRYRLRLRQKDNDTHTTLVDGTEHRSRVSAVYVGNGWGTKIQADATCSQSIGRSVGWMVSQSVHANLVGRLKVNAILGYFNTDDFDSRIYSYDPGMLYSFNFPAFYGEGIRYALMLRADIGKKLVCMAKAGTTRYFDRDVIGSGYQKVNHSSTTDVELQFRWNF
ncbi:MAG: helix-hairpin-helix domain-containing protein [Prevotella sp.]|nr:helix-hairpin-helix domain-containing protein [Prevotella sp.]